MNKSYYSRNYQNDDPVFPVTWVITEIIKQVPIKYM